MDINPLISYYTAISAAVILLVLWLVNRNTIQKYVRQTEK
jgi:hypothetical protein